MPRPRTPGELSGRERQVLSLVSHGYSNCEVARALGLNEQTVKTHMRRLMREIGAIDRAHAVRIGFEEGILVPSEVRRPRAGEIAQPGAVSA